MQCLFLSTFRLSLIFGCRIVFASCWKAFNLDSVVFDFLSLDKNLCKFYHNLIGLQRLCNRLLSLIWIFRHLVTFFLNVA